MASMHFQTHYRTEPAARNMIKSRRPDRGLCSEAVQPTVSRSYLPDGLAKSGMTLPRSLFLFSVCFFPTTSLSDWPEKKNRKMLSWAWRCTWVTLREKTMVQHLHLLPHPINVTVPRLDRVWKSYGAVSLLFPYAWDTVQQMHIFSLPSFFCSACHVEELIAFWLNDSWGWGR